MSSDSSRVSTVLAGLRALSSEIDRLDEVAAHHYGLNRTDMRALDLLGQGDALAPTALAKRLGITTGGVTTVIDRLERAGYVCRKPDPHDRRRLVVEITETTRDMDRKVFGALGQTTAAHIATYGDAELELINSFLIQVRQDTAEAIQALEHD
jgi:DNA-binding MarR family transcriptional regulator